MIRTSGVTHFWAIAPRAQGLDLGASHGAGPFDDPQGRVAALYGARELRTSLRELLESQAKGTSVSRVLGAENYELDALLIVASPEIDLLDLEASSMRERLARDPAVARALRDAGRSKLDRAALLPSTGLRALTRAVANAAIRGGLLDGTQIDGLCVPRSADSDTFVVFRGDAYDSKLRIALAEPLTPGHRTLREVATELGFDVVEPP